MARKSRKITVEQSAVQTSETSFPTAIYARLSVENSGKPEEKDVIQNQIEICKEYIKSCPYLSLVEVYADNGHTGTVFDRPEFNRLMSDIRSGKIKCLVVRDLSRFGRDYIETGTYLERVFPQIGLRFISVKERYDSFDSDGDSLIIPLQNMINALYSKDISRKVSTALHAKIAAGTYMGGNLPYGYCWNSERTNMIPDELTAPIVQGIFRWKIEGISNSEILNRLNEMNAPNPEQRKREVGTRIGDGCFCKGWAGSTLYGILSNPQYVGDTVHGRAERAIYKGIKYAAKDKSDRIIYPNTHEALVSREDFQKVQDIMSEASSYRQEHMRKTADIRASLLNLFDGKIVCADCGGKMYYHRRRVDKSKNGDWYAHYECSTHVSKRYEHCSRHYIRQDSLEEKVLAAIKLQVQAALDYDKLLIKLRGSSGEKSIRDEMNAKINSLTLKLGGISKKRARLYEDFTDGILNSEEYAYAKKAFDDEYSDLSRRLDEAVQRRNSFSEAMSEENRWIKLMKSVGNAERLTQELVDESIELVKVHEGGDIELTMKYRDIYELTVQSVKEVQEVMK